MKKLTAILLGALVIGSAAQAQTNQVLSRNAVGYIKINLASNSLNLISNPFLNLDPAITEEKLTNIFAVVPGGTIISIWDETLPIPAYVSFARNTRGVWTGTAPTATVKRADGVFVQIAKTNGVDLFFMGEVPDRFGENSNFMSRVPGITMIGHPYPVSVRLTNTVMAQQVPNGTIISVWIPAITNYVSYAKNTRGQWTGTAPTADLVPGQGLVINATNAANAWYETKPYTWP